MSRYKRSLDRLARVLRFGSGYLNSCCQSGHSYPRHIALTLYRIISSIMSTADSIASRSVEDTQYRMCFLLAVPQTTLISQSRGCPRPSLTTSRGTRTYPLAILGISLQLQRWLSHQTMGDSSCHTGAQRKCISECSTENRLQGKDPTELEKVQDFLVDSGLDKEQLAA